MANGNTAHPLAFFAPLLGFFGVVFGVQARQMTRLAGEVDDHETRISKVETHIIHIREGQERMEGKLDRALERE